ncbi:HNH endonuclease [Streptomyces violascens]|uniref:HNH endonuclease n=1 Tax=Streptomyces violascens TaxID=67381 RepID=UPI0036C0854C
MSLHDNPQLNSRRRRARKAQLAARDGQHCTYCHQPFATLQDATLDHVVPISLMRTWSADHLVLACRPCNTLKADRLPLSIALLLCQSAMNRAGVHGVFTGSTWLALARLATAIESTHTAVRSADPVDGQSTPDQRDESRHTRRHAPVPRSLVRPDCLHAPRPMRVCSRPTGEAVFA